MKKSLDENCNVLQSIRQFFNTNYVKNNRPINDLNEQQRKYGQELLRGSQIINPEMKQWVEEFVNKVLNGD